MLEELGVEYDAWLINIMKGDQFTSGFVSANPNSKIPAMYDYGVDPNDQQPVRVFETGSILMYLSEKHLLHLLCKCNDITVYDVEVYKA